MCERGREGEGEVLRYKVFEEVRKQRRFYFFFALSVEAEENGEKGRKGYDLDRMRNRWGRKEKAIIRRS